MVDLARKLNRHWSVSLDDQFRAHIDGKNLVFTAPGRTLVISIWNSKEYRSPGDIVADLKRMAHPHPVESYHLQPLSFERFGYLLLESDDERGARWALYTFCVTSRGYLQITFYFDDKQDLKWARKTWDSAQFESD